LAIDDVARVQNMLVDTPEADDTVSLQTRYSVKFQELLFFSEKTLLSTIKEARLALQESFGDEKPVN
jgi:hypothetical protein